MKKKKKYAVHLWVNGYEYLIHIDIVCNKLERLDGNRIVADGVVISYDGKIDHCVRVRNITNSKRIPLDSKR